MSDQRIMATFVPEAWVKDHAIEVDGRIDFDATDEILAMSEEERAELRDDSYASDRLVPAELLDRHQGPFRVEVEFAIEMYLLGDQPPQ